jgi:transposase
VLLLDQASWQRAQTVNIPDTITLLHLPAKCPKLNPAENLWQYMRDNWLSNGIFNDYSDILDHCVCAWNKRADRPWKIMSIRLRDWTQGY